MSTLQNWVDIGCYLQRRKEKGFFFRCNNFDNDLTGEKRGKKKELKRLFKVEVEKEILGISYQSSNIHFS